MKQFVTTFCVACLCLTAHAQLSIENFAIDAYLFPDIDRRTLGIDLDLAGSFVNDNIFGSGVNRVNASQRIHSAWSKFVNTRDVQITHTAYGSLAGSVFWSDSDLADVDHIFSIGPSGGASFTKRHYERDKFLEWGINGFVSYSYERQRLDESPLEIDKNNALNVQLALDLKKGKGRLEFIDDLVLALYTLQDMRDAGLIAEGELDSIGITGFADEMAVVRNDRVFDFRRFRIHQLESLYNYMNAQGWIADCSNPAYFAILNDNWQYAFRNVRQSGERYSFGITPNVFTNYSRQTNIDDGLEQYFLEEDYSWSIRGSFDFDKERVMSLEKQRIRSHRILIGYGWGEQNLDFNDQGSIYEKTEAIALTTINQIGWGFYPNSRTALEYGLEADLVVGWDFDQIVGVLQAGIFVNSSYFLSYRTRLNFAMSAFYTEDDDSLPRSLAYPVFSGIIASSRVRLNLNLSLTHDIF